ncbi:MAG: hypothetical protein QME61_01145 [Patescibacteria group bacterium]|nr:hypothetical protein [Patescibacteria group bacterium]
MVSYKKFDEIMLMVKIIKTQNILFQYLIWHFLEMPGNILKTWKNFLKFNLNYFSIHLLLRTFFFPWRRYRIPYGKGFDIERYLEAFFSNLIFRILGATVRSFLILTGILIEIFIILGGMIVFLGWLLLPILLLAGLYFGFKILI